MFKKKNKKGSVAIYISFMIVAFIIILIAAVLAPMGVEFNTQAYLAGQTILEQANESIQNINDAAIKAEVQGALDAAFDSAANNIEVNANVFQYSWIAVLFLSALTVFLFTRRVVEFSQGFGGFI